MKFGERIKSEFTSEVVFAKRVLCYGENSTVRKDLKRRGQSGPEVTTIGGKKRGDNPFYDRKKKG